MSTNSVEARLNGVEVQLASLLQSSQQQAALLERQSKLIELLLRQTDAGTSGEAPTKKRQG
jgi:hypothetical protein